MVTRLLDLSLCFSVDISWLILAKWTRPKEKMRISFYFYCPPSDSAISLKLMVPKKWFTYQNLQNFMGKKTVGKVPTQIIRMLIKVPTQKIQHQFSIFEPTCPHARWALMRRLLSVHLPGAVL